MGLREDLLKFLENNNNNNNNNQSFTKRHNAYATFNSVKKSDRKVKKPSKTAIKVIAGLLSGAIAIGGGIALLHNRDNTPPDIDSSYSETTEETTNVAPEVI